MLSGERKLVPVNAPRLLELPLKLADPGTNGKEIVPRLPTLAVKTPFCGDPGGKVSVPLA